MTIAPDGTTRPTIGSQWIKANAIGVTLWTASASASFPAGQVLGINRPPASVGLQTAFVVVASAAMTSSFLVLGYLSAVVLRTKLPAFPMQRWLALYFVLSVISSLVQAFSWLTPETEQNLDSVRADIVAAAIGSVVISSIISVVVGSLQALILRPAAQGLGLWIACATFAGAPVTLVALIAGLYGPQSGLARELTSEFVIWALMIFQAFVMLPAVLRLQPR
ncbi:MAG: hypothetical protein K2Y71_18830 [Xanthobacteraceae bacterium]|nr:hypothetical protein [Xanthobacteraceae bacterium]